MFFDRGWRCEVAITPEVFEEAITGPNGHAVARQALNDQAVERLRRSAFTMGRVVRSRGYKYGARYGYTPLRRDTRKTAVRHPVMTELMRASRDTVQRAGAALDEDTLREWGERRPNGFGSKLFTARNDIAVHRVSPGGWFDAHRDNRNLYGVVIIYNVEGVRTFELHPPCKVNTSNYESIYQVPGFPATSVDLEPGDALVMAARKFGGLSATYPGELPWHGIENNGEGKSTSYSVGYKVV